MIAVHRGRRHGKGVPMKNFFNLFRIIAVVAIIGIGVAGCDNGTTDDDNGGPLNGTWVQDNAKLVFNNGSYTLWAGNYPLERGTYSINGGNITIQPVDMYHNNTWLDQAQSLATGEYDANNFLPWSGTYVLTNNNETLTLTFWGTWIKSQ
jgi:hypothetical protein